MTSCLSQHKYKIGFWGVLVPGTQIIASYANPNAHAFYHDGSIGNIPGIGDIPNIVPATVIPALFALVMYGIYKAIKSCKPAAETPAIVHSQKTNSSSSLDSGPEPQTMGMDDDVPNVQEKKADKQNNTSNTSSSDCCSCTDNRWDAWDYLCCWIVLDDISNRNSASPTSSYPTDTNCCSGGSAPDCDNPCTGGDGCNCNDCNCDLGGGGCDCDC
jgi:hypothetical protein